MSTEKNIGAHFHARLRAQKFYAIAFAFSTTSSMVPESKNADSGISSCLPSRISLKPLIVSESGKVSNTALHIEAPYTEENINLLSKTLTYNYRGKTVSQALTGNIIKDFESDIEALSKLAENIMPNFVKTLENMLNVDLYTSGITNIFSTPEFNDIDRAKEFLEMMSRKEDLTKNLVNRQNGVIITIGDENSEEILPDCSLITATYHIDGKLVGKIGVIGPKRMRYDEITSIVEFMTENLSNTFKLTDGKENE